MSETPEYTRLAREFEDMDRDRLLYEARRWCFNAIQAKETLDHYKAGVQRERDERVLQLARVCALVSVRRKTVRMDDLINALKDSAVLDAEADANVMSAQL